MQNKGLFSSLYINSIEEKVKFDDAIKRRLEILNHQFKNLDNTSAVSIWDSFVKKALSILGFIPKSIDYKKGFYLLYEDYNYENLVTAIFINEPAIELNNVTAGCFPPGKLIINLKENNLNWGILTNGKIWRIYSLKSTKPFEEYVEVDRHTGYF